MSLCCGLRGKYALSKQNHKYESGLKKGRGLGQYFPGLSQDHLRESSRWLRIVVDEQRGSATE